MSSGHKVAYIVPEFPKLSETAILTEVLGLLDAGVDLRIVAFVRPSEGLCHPDAESPRLQGRTFYIRRFGWGVGRAWSAMGSLWHLVRYPTRSSQLRAHMREHAIPTRYLSGLSRVTDYLRAIEPDLVHVQFGHVARFLAPVCDWLDRPLVISFRGWDASCFPARAPRAYASLFASTSRALPRSNSMADDLATLGCPREKIVVHHSGIDLRKFPLSPRPPVRNGRVRLLTVGRLVDKKGIPAAIGALRRCLAEYPNAILSIIGSGPKERDLRQLVRNLRMQRNVLFLGEKTQTEVAEEMRRSHLFVLPSQKAWDGDKEGIPNAIMEAMASGLPVLSTEHAGIPECVKHGKSGLLVPEKDVDALAKAMQTLMGQPTLWDEMGRAGRARVEQEFDAQRQTQSLLEIYNQVLQGRSRD